VRVQLSSHRAPQYRKLDVENYVKYETVGLHYAGTAMESVLCRDQEIVVVGGWQLRWAGVIVSLRYRKNMSITICVDRSFAGNDVAIFNFRA